jgi:hypothetical protein
VKVLVLTPDGVGVRNFLLGPFLRLATTSGIQATALHIIPDELLAPYQEGAHHTEWVPFRSYREDPVSATLRYSLFYAHMFRVRTRSMQFNLKFIRRSRGSWKHHSLQATARVIGRVAASVGGGNLLARWHAAVVGQTADVEHYRTLLRRIKPDVLFCSHQRPPVILPPVLAARSLGIPTASFIFSWDNLTSKGRIAAPFDHYLVWSDLMRDELLRYYQHVPADRVHVVGTPQFDPYGDDSLLWSREEFCSRFGMDPRRQIICYSGGDDSISPEDPQHVSLLMDAVRSGAIHGCPQVLLRPAPVDDGTRYAEVRQRFPELVYAQPEWVHTVARRWDMVIPTANDVQFLANLTRHADLNINVASTMTLDFAARDRPVVNIAFDVADPPPFGVPLWEHHYGFEHYRPVIDFAAARFARSKTELVEHVNAYLADPSLDRTGRRRLVEFQVGRPIGSSSQCILNALAAIAGATDAAPAAISATAAAH